MPELGVLQQIEKDFGSFTNFREKFVAAALTLFGSGWVWLVGKLVSVFPLYFNLGFQNCIYKILPTNPFILQ